MGICFTLTFLPCLLFSGPLIEGFDKTNVLGFGTAINGFIVMLHSMVMDAREAMVLISLAGICQGFCVSLSYQIVTEFFAPKYKTKAFVLFSISKQASDSILFLTPLLISATGWRMAWAICGGVGIIGGMLLVFTISEPIKRQDIVLTKNCASARVIAIEAEEFLNTT